MLEGPFAAPPALAPHQGAFQHPRGRQAKLGSGLSGQLWPTWEQAQTAAPTPKAVCAPPSPGQGPRGCWSLSWEVSLPYAFLLRLCQRGLQVAPPTLGSTETLPSLFPRHAGSFSELQQSFLGYLELLSLSKGWRERGSVSAR